MKIEMVSWNSLNGFAGEKSKKLFSRFPNADVFVIQECKLKDTQETKLVWEQRKWYGDDQDEKSDLGVAVLSRKHKVEFIDDFNRKFRYVVPYRITVNKKPLTIFAVWTKSTKRGEFDYAQNVIQAVDYYHSKGLLDKDVIIIGDFNTGHIDSNPERYRKLSKNLKAKGLLNSSQVEIKDFEMTFFFDKNKEMYLNDFCFVSEKFVGKNLKLTTHNDWGIKGGKKRWNGSDHCPISVEFDI